MSFAVSFEGALYAVRGLRDSGARSHRRQAKYSSSARVDNRREADERRKQGSAGGAA